MVGRRRKGKKTHIKPSDSDLARIPRSFVVKHGHVSASAKALSRDLRKIYRPWTAVNLRERKRATLKDYSSVGGPLAISHLLVVKQRQTRVYLSVYRLRGGEGPTCHFRVLSYSLAADIQRCQAKPRTCDTDFVTSPIVITQGFERFKKLQAPKNEPQNVGPKNDGNRTKLETDDVEILEQESGETLNEEQVVTEENLKLLRDQLVLQSFPTITRSNENGEDATGTGARIFNGVRRVLLFSYVGDDVFDLRHYAIEKTSDFKKLIHIQRRQSSPKKELKEEEEDVKVKREILEEEEQVDFIRKNLSLIELGPRLTLKLVKFQNKLPPGLSVPEDQEDAVSSDEEDSGADCDDTHSQN